VLLDQEINRDPKVLRVLHGLSLSRRDSGSQPAAFASAAFQVLTRCLPAFVVSLAGAVDAGSSLIVSDEGERRKRDVGRGGGRRGLLGLI
jgi:hypothetical protein